MDAYAKALQKGVIGVDGWYDGDTSEYVSVFPEGLLARGIGKTDMIFDKMLDMASEMDGAAVNTGKEILIEPPLFDPNEWKPKPTSDGQLKCLETIQEADRWKQPIKYPTSKRKCL